MGQDVASFCAEASGAINIEPSQRVVAARTLIIMVWAFCDTIVVVFVASVSEDNIKFVLLVDEEWWQCKIASQLLLRLGEEKSSLIFPSRALNTYSFHSITKLC